MRELYNTTNLVSEDTSQSALERIVRAIMGIRYGSVEIVIHDGHIVQIERKEKMRFDVSNNRPANR